MKKHIVIIHFLLLLVIVGCGTLYGVAVEERKTSTIVADAKITTAIQNGFLKDSDVKSLDISAYCYNGHVYLVGEYDRAPQKERAIIIAGLRARVWVILYRFEHARKDFQPQVLLVS